MSRVGHDAFYDTCLHGSFLIAGLQRARDKLMEQLMELNKSKPRGKESEILIAEISRLESSLGVARDDLVCSDCYPDHVQSCLTLLPSQNACKAKLDGVKSELKHTDREIRQLQPELRKVRFSSTREHEKCALS